MNFYHGVTGSIAVLLDSTEFSHENLLSSVRREPGVRRVLRGFFLVFLFTLFVTVNAFAQQSPFVNDEPERGDSAMAERYLLWAEDAFTKGNWAEARASLERAADFADVSSDISYLLALVRSQENESRLLALETVKRAIGTNRWRHYTEARARLLEAEQLITLRRYSSALNSLAAYKTLAGEDADSALLRLAALKGLVNGGGDSEPDSRARAFSPPFAPVEFRRYMLETIDRYPRDPRPLRLFFEYASRRDPDRDDIALMDIAVRRLPFLLETDQELAWMAAPFISDADEARRLVLAYRAGSLRHRADNFKPNPASIIQALNLGLLDDNDAIDELFTESVLEREILAAIGNLLRGDEGRDYLARKLHSFTGAITDDEDHDGYAESRAIYHEGSLQEYYHDADQDGVADLFVAFIAGSPQQAEMMILPELGNGRTQVLIYWERYPSVLRTIWETESYTPAPGAFQFSPVKFTELCTSKTYAGLLFPRRDSRASGLNRRMLASFAASVQRPSPEFKGGVEQVFLERGRPVRAEVTLNGSIVSFTEFENGYPLIQRLDMDLDGRMETVRHFDRKGLRSSENDRNGGGLFAAAELYREDGSIVYSWDLDGNGKFDYEQ
ncbi:MAG: hypothetical protein LBG95_06465 [Treponema sp.]|jgi:hypothetical protein|nr:hypothetical protein [Treponema sp.]